MAEKKIVTADEIVEMEKADEGKKEEVLEKKPAKPKWTIVMGKKPQIQKSPICDPHNKLYDPKVAARRRKEKARRKANAKRIARSK